MAKTQDRKGRDQLSGRAPREVVGSWIAASGGLIQATVGLAVLVLPLFGTCDPTLGSLGGATARGADCERYSYIGNGSLFGYAVLAAVVVVGLAAIASLRLAPSPAATVRWCTALVSFLLTPLFWGLAFVLLPGTLVLLVGAVVGGFTNSDSGNEHN